MDVLPAAALAQFLTTCPGCGGAAAAHVDSNRPAPVLVRLVCAEGCPVDGDAVLAALGLLTEALPLPAA
jgi:hypothetical protein